MVLSRLSALAALAACLSHASGTEMSSQIQASVMSSLKLYSKAEIMATMTEEKAMHVVTHSRRLKKRPDVLAMIQSEFAAQANNSLKTVKAHHQSDTTTLPKGYAGVEKAKNMLNEMMNSASAKLENENQRCTGYNTDTLGLLEDLRGSVSSFNSKAAGARGKILKAQGEIKSNEEQISLVEDRLDEHNKQCDVDISALKFQIEIVLADLDVMSTILEIIGDCDAAAQNGFLQCRHCDKSGNGVVMLQDTRLQKMLKKLKSTAAQEYVKQNLNEMYAQSTEDQEPVMLTQAEVHRQRVGLLGQRQLRAQQEQDEQSPAGDAEELDATDGNGTNVSEVPEVVQPANCIPTDKCTLGKGSCTAIRDRFLNIQAGIQDLHSDLTEELTNKVKSCDTEKETMETQLGNLNNDLSTAQGELADATKEQVEAELSSHLTSKQHTKKKTEYGSTMKDCCQEQNDLKSEICALEKIRGELLKMKGVSVFISDCEVTDWDEDTCSETCGGGTMKMIRSIMVHPVGGAECPPLEMRQTCNAHPCPIDCKVNAWEEWSQCTAECGGGVKERVRSVERAAEHGGLACEKTEESQVCHGEACDQDCILEEWSEWGACSQACWGGTQRRERAEKTPATGTGSCQDPTDEARLAFRSCNEDLCKKFYFDGASGDYLKCGALLDVVILMDGSGSLGRYGWKKSKIFVDHLLRSFEGSDTGVKVALELFSGPTNWKSYKKCTGVKGAPAPDMEKDCKILWVSHFTNDTVGLADKVNALKFPRATTLTSVALAEAEAELVYGREEANSVVVVVTDGKPMSKRRTKVAAHNLKSKARVVWVPIGPGAPTELIEELASLPKRENVIRIPSFYELKYTTGSNRVIAQSCPLLMNPNANATSTR